MTLYHGSKAKFETFNRAGTGKHGRGFYFTPDFNEARAFAYSLAGDGSSDIPKVYTVELNYSSLFDTMSVSMCEEVCAKLGTKYKIPPSAGGAKEHYYYLDKQLKNKGLTEDLNKTLLELGYDGIYYGFMEHVIVFSENQITITKVEEV